MVPQVRAVNYAVNLQEFVVFIIYSVESVGECTKLLRDSDDVVYVGMCLFQDSIKPTGILYTNMSIILCI